MSARQLATVWLAALALAAALLFALIWQGERAAAARAGPPPAIVAIGSSLTAYGIPPSTADPAQSLLGDGRAHRRIAAGRITEPQLLAALDHALDEAPALILLEANPLLVDFADRARQRPCDGWAFRLRHALADSQRRIIEAWRAARGRPPAFIYTADPRNIDSPYAPDPAVTARTYPFLVRSPCDLPRLAAAAARARAQGTRLVLVLPPRSMYAARLLGPARVRALEARATALASELGVPLFITPGDWPNSRFIDKAHMNLAGRAAFLTALRRWHASGPA